MAKSRLFALELRGFSILNTLNEKITNVSYFSYCSPIAICNEATFYAILGYETDVSILSRPVSRKDSEANKRN